MHGINSVRRASENISRQSIKAMEGLANQSDLPRNISDNLLNQISGITGRFENQGEQIDAYNLFKTANYKIDKTLQNRHPAIQAVEEEIRRVCEEAVTAEELEHAKNGVIGELLIDLQKNSQQSQQLALDTLYGLGPRFVFEAPGKVEKLTAADIQAVAKKYLVPGKSVRAVTRPGK